MQQRKRGQKWDDELLVEIQRLLNEGYSYYAIGKKLRIGDRQIAIRFPGHGKKAKGKPDGWEQFYISPEKKAECQELFDQGSSIAEVHRKTGVALDCLYAKYHQYAYTPSQSATVASMVQRFGRDILK